MPTTISSTTAPPAPCSTTPTAMARRRGPVRDALGRPQPDRGGFHRRRTGEQPARDHFAGDRAASRRTARRARSSTRPRPPTPTATASPGRWPAPTRRALTIDATGAVRLKASPNFEAKSSYSIQRDGQRFRNARRVADVTLSVTDVERSATPIINETAATNDAVATAQAIDRARSARRRQSESARRRPAFGDDRREHLARYGRPGLFQHHLAGRRAADPRRRRQRRAISIRMSASTTPTASRSATMTISSSFDPGSAPIRITATTPIPSFSFRAPTAGTYYFSIESLPGPGQSDVRHLPAPRQHRPAGDAGRS